MLKGKLKAAVVFFGLLEGASLPIQAEEIGLYNESAMVDCKNSWDVVFNADYIYWIWQQSGMSVGTLVTPSEPGAAGLLNGQESVVLQTPGYSSGFQVGLGCNFHGMDDWRFKADYTWYENTDHLRTVSSIQSLRTITEGDQYFAVSPSFIKTPGGLKQGVLLSGDLLSIAKLRFDELDGTLQRMFYQGSRLTARYSMGLKALWLNEYGQSNGTNLYFVGQNINFPVPLQGSFQTSAVLQSWALGPVFGFEANWLLGYGIRIESVLKGSLLYTSYTQLQFALTGQISDTGSADLLLDQSKKYNTVSPVLQASLGLGWGSYFCDQNLYFDLFLGYDFNVYWTRTVLDAVRNNTGAPGSLCLQGLNFRAGVDF
jgi:hypothetical protein